MWILPFQTKEIAHCLHHQHFSPSFHQSLTTHFLIFQRWPMKPPNHSPCQIESPDLNSSQYYAEAGPIVPEDCQQNTRLKEFLQNRSDNKFILSPFCTVKLEKNKVDIILQLRKPLSHSHCQLDSRQCPIQRYDNQYHLIRIYLRSTARHLTH